MKLKQTLGERGEASFSSALNCTTKQYLIQQHNQVYQEYQWNILKYPETEPQVYVSINP